MSEEQQNETTEQQATIHFFNGFESKNVSVPLGTSVSNFLQEQGIVTDKFMQFQGQQGVGLLQLLHNDTVTLAPAFPSVVLVDGDKLKVMAAAMKGGL